MENVIDQKDLDLQLVQAADKGQVDQIKTLLSDSPTASPHALCCCALQVAARKGFGSIVEMMLESIKETRDEIIILYLTVVDLDKKIYRLLHLPGHTNKDSDVCNMLYTSARASAKMHQLLAWAGLNTQEGKDKALSWAVHKGHENIVLMLIKHGANPLQNEVTDAWDTELMYPEVTEFLGKHDISLKELKTAIKNGDEAKIFQAFYVKELRITH